MQLQLGEVTRVFTDEIEWAQLCNISGKLTDREFQNVDIVTPKGMNYIPSVWDTILFTELTNSVIVAIWVIEEMDLGLKWGEVFLHKGIKTVTEGKTTYDLQAYIKIDDAGYITLASGTSTWWAFTPTVQVSIGNGQVNIT